jgi:hypothetical protein
MKIEMRNKDGTCLDRVYIDPEEYQKLCTWVEMAKGEISFLGLLDEYRGAPYISKLYLPKQQNTGATTSMDEGVVGRLLYDLGKEGLDGKLRCWIHSHANMEVFWSGTDTGTIEGFQSDDVFVSVVVNKKGKYKVRLDVFTPLRFVVEDLSLEVAIPEYDVKSECEAAFKENVSEGALPGAKITTSVGQNFVTPQRWDFGGYASGGYNAYTNRYDGYKSWVDSQEEAIQPFRADYKVSGAGFTEDWFEGEKIEEVKEKKGEGDVLVTFYPDDIKSAKVIEEPKLADVAAAELEGVSEHLYSQAELKTLGLTTDLLFDENLDIIVETTDGDTIQIDSKEDIDALVHGGRTSTEIGNAVREMLEGKDSLLSDAERFNLSAELLERWTVQLLQGWIELTDAIDLPEHPEEVVNG